MTLPLKEKDSPKMHNALPGGVVQPHDFPQRLT